MSYQSPISPGRSWYDDTVGDRPDYPALDGDRSCDVVIVGGGFTGLSAATHLAKTGTNVVLVEAHRFGDGASGRNGGQLGTGHRAWAEEMEEEYGFSRAKALLFNAISGMASVLGGVLGYLLIGQFELALPYLLVLAASSFIYISVADLLPQLQQRLAWKDTFAQVAWLAVGLGVAFAVSTLLHGAH